MQIQKGTPIAISGERKWTCQWCKQKFRTRPDTINEIGFQKYCSPYCRKKMARERAEKTPLIYKCKTCDSLVKGSKASVKRKYCTTVCFNQNSNQILPSDLTIRKLNESNVQILEPGPGIAKGISIEWRYLMEIDKKQLLKLHELLVKDNGHYRDIYLVTKRLVQLGFDKDVLDRKAEKILRKLNIEGAFTL